MTTRCRGAKLAADMTGFQNCGVITSPEGFRTFGLKTNTLKSLSRSLRQARLAPHLESPVVPNKLPGALREAMKKGLRP